MKPHDILYVTDEHLPQLRERLIAIDKRRRRGNELEGIRRYSVKPHHAPTDAGAAAESRIGPEPRREHLLVLREHIDTADGLRRRLSRMRRSARNGNRIDEMLVHEIARDIRMSWPYFTHINSNTYAKVPLVFSAENAQSCAVSCLHAAAPSPLSAATHESLSIV